MEFVAATNERILGWTFPSRVWHVIFKSFDVEGSKEMEVLFDVIERGKLKIQLSVLDNHGYIVIITANDEEDRRVFKAPVLENGKVKTFESPEAAILAAKKRLLSLAPHTISGSSND